MGKLHSWLSMKKSIRYKLISLGIAIATVIPAWANTTVNVGSASTFGLLGGTISNTGTSEIKGNVGVIDASGTITGFYPTGTTVFGSVVSPGSPLSNNAYIDFVNAFNAAESLASTQGYGDLTVDRTFIGNNVYTFGQPNISTTTGISLMFDAQNDPSEVFVIRVDEALTVNGAMTFTLQNQARADHIYWIVGTIATISVGSSGPIVWEGNILAGQSFTMSASAGGSGVLAGTINGCVYSETANTLAGTTNVNCAGPSPRPVMGSAQTPEPGSLGLVCLGCMLGILARRKIARRTASF